MDERPDDLDTARAAVAARGLVTVASKHLTEDVAMSLPFEALGSFKTLLKQFFSGEEWGRDHTNQLANLLAPHITDGWWEHALDDELALAYGVRGGSFVLWATGAGTRAPSLFDRVFTGPVVPEATPHPRKVKFAIGGQPAPGRWYQRSDPDPPEDERVVRLFEELDVTDVMVAGDFVTVGLSRSSSWENRLDALLDLVTRLFWRGEGTTDPERTREELLREAGRTHLGGAHRELHLLDPDASDDRSRLESALQSLDVKDRRIAVAILAESADAAVRTRAIQQGYADSSRIVRRGAIDAAADLEDPALRPLFERAFTDEDAWIRWKAVRAIGDIGVSTSRAAVAALAEDPDFTVRFEVARILR